MTKKEIKALTQKDIELWQMKADYNRKCNQMLDAAYKALNDYIQPHLGAFGLLPNEIVQSAEYKRLTKDCESTKKKVQQIRTMVFGSKVFSSMNDLHQLERLGIIK